MGRERRNRGKLLTGILALLPVAAGVWITGGCGLWGSNGKSSGRAATQHAKPQPAIPVTFEIVRLSDFPVYLDGLGTVQPYDTVTVRSRVDGEVVKVAFRQGKMVKRGDVLVQIDPRPFEAALAQAQEPLRTDAD